MKRYIALSGFSGDTAGCELLGMYRTKKEAKEALHAAAEMLFEYYDEEQWPTGDGYEEYSFWNKYGESFGYIQTINVSEDCTYNTRLES